MARRSLGFSRRIVLAQKLGEEGVKLLRHGGGGPRRIEERVRILYSLAGRKQIGMLPQSVAALGADTPTGAKPGK